MLKFYSRKVKRPIRDNFFVANGEAFKIPFANGNPIREWGTPFANIHKFALGVDFWAMRLLLSSERERRGGREGAERGQRGGRSADHSRNKRTIRETNAPFANQTHVSRNKLTIRETNSRSANQTHHSRNKRAIRETNALFANKGTHLNVPSFQRPRKLPAKAHRPGFILGDDHGGKKRRIQHTAIAGANFDQHNVQAQCLRGA